MIILMIMIVVTMIMIPGITIVITTTKKIINILVMTTFTTVKHTRIAYLQLLRILSPEHMHFPLDYFCSICAKATCTFWHLFIPCLLGSVGSSAARKSSCSWSASDKGVSFKERLLFRSIEYCH